MGKGPETVRVAILSTLMFLLLFGYVFLFTELRFQRNLQFEEARVVDLVAGKASKPFQYRVLIPWCIDLLQKLSTEPFSLAALATSLFWIEFISLVLLAVLFRSFLLNIFVIPRLANIGTAFLFYGMTFNFIFNRHNPYWYPSDIPSLVFFTLGLSFLYRERWSGYWAVLLLGTLNRETTIFLVFIYVLTSAGKKPLRELLGCTCLQILAWASIKCGLWHYYLDSPGPVLFQTKFESNVQLLMNPSSFVPLFLNMGCLWLPVVLFRRDVREEFLKRALWVCLPFLGGMFFVGNLLELRIWGELIPLFSASLVGILKTRSFSTPDTC